ncbi:MAG: hypothetical protein IJL66_07630 [Lachnospiraceae bacterium]|nr:hypothetical protein [Lachnospiraceae bacterium]
MRFRALRLTALLLALLLIAAGCSSKPKEAEKKPFGLGSWEGTTFVNEWFDLKLTVPEKSQILTKEQIAQVNGAGQDVLVEDGVLDEKDLEKLEGTTFYDFYVFNEDSTVSMSLGYEKMPSGMTASAYLASIKNQLKSLTSMQYEIGDTSKTELAGYTYHTLQASMYEGYVQQRYLVREQDGFAGFLILTYQNVKADEAEKLLENVTKP